MKGGLAGLVPPSSLAAVALTRPRAPEPLDALGPGAFGASPRVVYGGAPVPEPKEARWHHEVGRQIGVPEDIPRPPALTRRDREEPPPHPGAIAETPCHVESHYDDRCELPGHLRY